MCQHCLENCMFFCCETSLFDARVPDLVPGATQPPHNTDFSSTNTYLQKNNITPIDWIIKSDIPVKKKSKKRINISNDTSSDSSGINNNSSDNEFDSEKDDDILDTGISL